MSDLSYTVIKTEKQYNEYCEILENLLSHGLLKQSEKDEYELLQLLISDWDRRHHKMDDMDPVELIKSLIDDHGLNQTQLAKIAGVGKSYISEILNYKKKMSKDVIRKIAGHFKIRQEALNKPYRLEGDQPLFDEKSERDRISVSQ